MQIKLFFWIKDRKKTMSMSKTNLQNLCYINVLTCSEVYTPLAKWTASDASTGFGISKSCGTRWHCFSNWTKHVTFPLILQSSSKNQAPSREVRSTSCSPALEAAPSIIRLRLNERNTCYSDLLGTVRHIYNRGDFKIWKESNLNMRQDKGK